MEDYPGFSFRPVWNALARTQLEGMYGKPRGTGKGAADIRSRILGGLNYSPPRQGRSRGRKPRKTGRK